MRHRKFSERELKFLDLFWGGAQKRVAARLAGYKGRSDQALCNSAARVLKKFYNNPKALLCRAGARERRIVQYLVDTAEHGKSEHQQLKALELLAVML